MTVTILRFARTSEKWQLQGLSRLLGLVRVKVPVVTALSPIHVLDSALRPHPGSVTPFALAAVNNQPPD
jgi:hypothetical protein